MVHSYFQKTRWETSELDDLKVVEGVLGAETIFFAIFTFFVAFSTSMKDVNKVMLTVALAVVTSLMLIGTFVQVMHVHDFEKKSGAKIISEKKVN